jgi:hypothetical protein
MPYKRNQEAPGTGNAKLTEEARKEIYGRSETESDPDVDRGREDRAVHSNVPSPSGERGAPGHGGADRHST